MLEINQKPLSVDRSVFQTPMNGALIAIEGVDASGKSSLVKEAKNTLEKMGLRVGIFSSFSGYTGYWETVMDSKKSMENSGNPIPPEVDQSLHTMEFLTRARHLLPDLLSETDVVFADRYVLSRIALCRWDIGQKYSWPEKTVVDALCRSSISKPDLTVLLDLDPDLARRRIVLRGPPFEVKEELEHLKSVRRELLSLTQEVSDCNCEVISADNTIENLTGIVVARAVTIRQRKDSKIS